VLRVGAQEMIFALVKIGGTKHRDHSYAYYSVIMETGASAKWTNPFESEDEMITVMNGILASQKKGGDVLLTMRKSLACPDRPWLNPWRHTHRFGN